MTNATQTKPAPDAWVRWSAKNDGWAWAVFRGAQVLAEGCERGRADAQTAARAALAKVQP